MKTLSANELKTKGISSIRDSLKNESEAILTVRGKAVYAVMSIDKFEELREYELECALAKCKKDVKGRKFHTDTDRHIRNIEKALSGK